MKTNLLIIILLIFNITYSQTDTIKQSKVSVNICYVGNIQIVDRNIFTDGRKQIIGYPINGEQEYLGFYDIYYKATFSKVVNINLFIRLYKKLALTTGINTFSERIKYTVKSVYPDNYTVSSYDIWTNKFLTIPLEFSYTFKLKHFELYPYLGANLNALFRIIHETDYAPWITNGIYTETNKKSLFHSRIFVGFVGGVVVSKKIYKKLDLLLKINFQPSTKILLVDNVDVYSGVHSFGLGVGIKYNF